MTNTVQINSWPIFKVTLPSFISEQCSAYCTQNLGSILFLSLNNLLFVTLFCIYTVIRPCIHSAILSLKCYHYDSSCCPNSNVKALVKCWKFTSKATVKSYKQTFFRHINLMDWKQYLYFFQYSGNLFFQSSVLGFCTSPVKTITCLHFWNI